MTILIDIDDVLNNLCECWIKHLDEKYGYNVKYDDVVDWNMHNYFPTLTQHELYDPLSDETFWASVKPRKDAVLYLKKLYDDKHDIYLCSATHYKNVKIKFENIILKYYPYIQWEKVIITNNKRMIKADVLIDDGIHNLAGGDYFKILYTAPHNKSFPIEKYGIVRADNWEEIYRIIGGLK